MRTLSPTGQGAGADLPDGNSVQTTRDRNRLRERTDLPRRKQKDDGSPAPSSVPLFAGNSPDPFLANKGEKYDSRVDH